MAAVSCSLSSLGDVYVMAAELCMCVDFQHGRSRMWSLNVVYKTVRILVNFVCVYMEFYFSKISP